MSDLQKQPTWRVGRKVGRTIYRDDVLVGVMDTPELAAEVVRALLNYQQIPNESRISNSMLANKCPGCSGSGTVKCCSHSDCNGSDRDCSVCDGTGETART